MGGKLRSSLLGLGEGILLMLFFFMEMNARAFALLRSEVSPGSSVLYNNIIVVFTEVVIII